MNTEVTKEYRTLQTQVRLLFVYALVLTGLGIWLALRNAGGAGARNDSDLRNGGEGRNSDLHVRTLSAEKVDIVEPDGTVKLCLFNKEHLPAAVINGVKMSRSGGGESGLMFYNEEGVECGGLIYSGKTAGAFPVSGMGLTMDKYHQDQEIQIDHEQDTAGGRPISSNLIVVTDRPDFSIDKALARLDSAKKAGTVQQLVDGGAFGRQRLQLGRKFSKDVGLFLRDDQGRPRLEVLVDKDNQPHIRFYDEKGALTAELPARR